MKDNIEIEWIIYNSNHENHTMRWEGEWHKWVKKCWKVKIATYCIYLTIRQNIEQENR